MELHIACVGQEYTRQAQQWCAVLSERLVALRRDVEGGEAADHLHTERTAVACRGPRTAANDEENAGKKNTF
jgi:hypothetical protein